MRSTFGLRATALFLAGLVLLCFGMGARAATQPLTYTLPIARTDGSPLTNLASVRIFRGTSAAAVQASATPIATVPVPATGYTDTTAPTGTVYYQATAVDANGLESARTPVVSAVVKDANPNPPLNLTPVVQAADTKVYKQRNAVGTFSAVAFASATVGAPLDTSHFIGDPTGVFCPIDRVYVTLRSRFDTFPPVSYARCL